MRVEKGVRVVLTTGAGRQGAPREQLQRDGEVTQFERLYYQAATCGCVATGLSGASVALWGRCGSVRRH